MSSGRNSKALAATRMVNLIRSNPWMKNVFKTTELTNLEAALKDDVFRYPWFYNLVNTVLNDGIVVSDQELKLYNKANKKTNERKDIAVVKTQIAHLKEKMVLLSRQKEILQQKLLEQTENATRYSVLPSLELKLRNSWKSLNAPATKNYPVENPSNFVNDVVQRLNSSYKDVFASSSETFLDELALMSTESSKENVLSNVRFELMHRLKEIIITLEKVEKDCLRVSNALTATAKHEFLWRDQLTLLMTEIVDEKCKESADDEFVFMRRPALPVEEATVPNFETRDELTDLIKQLNEKIQVNLA